MYDPSFSDKACEEYLEWLMVNRKIFDRINALIKDIRRNGLMSGIGKPEGVVNTFPDRKLSS